MKIISWNVNGIRAACGHGFWEAFKNFDADIICLQEVKAFEHEIPRDLFSPSNGYELITNSSQTPGRAGVAVFTKIKPDSVETKIGLEPFDCEGRYLKLKISNFKLVNLYLPHGGRAKEHLPYKLEVYDYLAGKLDADIIVGDFNIAHDERDLARPKENKNNIMFTAEERERLDKLTAGFKDTFRIFVKDGGHYSWWPYYREARARNLGWRLDYIFAAGSLAPRVKNAFILPEVACSDHSPVGADLIFHKKPPKLIQREVR